MLADDPQLRKLIYEVGLKFRDKLNQKAMQLVTVDANGTSTAFYFFDGDDKLKILIDEVRSAADYLETSPYETKKP